MSGEREEKSFGSRETLRSGAWTGEEERSFGERETLRSGDWGIMEEWEGKRWKAGEEILGRYVVEGELGQGGMGVVYACLDKVGGVRVAVKALPPELSHNSVEMEEVRENFELVVGLRHPNIAGVRTLEKDGQGEYFLVMDVAEGESLRKWMRKRWKAGGIPLEGALEVSRQVASALDYAHGERVVHRDVKPGNVMIDGRGRVKVLDFGLAAQIRTSMSRASQAYRGTSGTGPYMAPEQWEAQPQDAKTDQYALAVMAYEMLAGRLPFENSEPSVLREAVLKGQARDIPGLPKAAMGALRRAMAKRGEERFGSCGEFVAALGGAGRRRNARGKTLLGWVAALALLGAGAWWGVKQTVRPGGSPPQETVAGETTGEMPAPPEETRWEATLQEEGPEVPAKEEEGLASERAAQGGQGPERGNSESTTLKEEAEPQPQMEEATEAKETVQRTEEKEAVERWGDVERNEDEKKKYEEAKRVPEANKHSVSVPKQKDPAQLQMDAYVALAQAEAAVEATRLKDAELFFRQALDIFTGISRDHPDFSPAVIRFRVTYCQNQLADLEARLGPSSSSSSVNPSSPAEHELDLEIAYVQSRIDTIKRQNGTPSQEAADLENKAYQTRLVELEAEKNALQEFRTTDQVASVPARTAAVLSPDNTSPRPIPPGADPAAFVRQLLADGENKAALATIRQARLAAPDDLNLALIEGIALIRLDAYDDASALLIPLARANPKHAEIRATLGAAMMGAGNYDQARDTLEEAVKLDKKLAEVHYNLALLYAFATPVNEKLARRHYREALSLGIDPDPNLEAFR